MGEPFTGMASGARSRKIAFAFVLVVLAGACAAIFILVFRDAKRAEIDRLNERQRIHARQAAIGLEEYFRNWTGILASLARIDEVVDVSPRGRAYLDLFAEAHQGQVRSVTRVSEKGLILYTVPYRSSAGSDISGQKHVREILSGRRPVVSDVFRTVQGYRGVALHVPVFRGSAFKGTLAVVFDFEKLAGRHFGVIRVGDTGYAWAIGQDGTMLYNPVPGLTGKSATELAAPFPPLAALVREMQRGGTGTASYEYDRIGSRRVAPVRKHGVYMPVRLGNTFWSVAVASSEAEVVSALSTFRNRLILAMGAVLLGGLVLSTMGAKAWLIVREEGKRRRAEEELRESEGRYRELYERNPAPILICEKETFRILSVNEAFLRHYGYGAGEVAALRLPDLYPAEEKEAIVSLASRLSGHAYVGEWHHLRKDGSVIAIVVTSHDITYAGRRARVAVVTDITARKAAEDQLRDLKETLEEKVRERTAELERKNGELERLNRLFVDREFRIRELKDRVRSLEAASGTGEPS